jgi:PAS domain S-box-containing protein
MRLTDDRPIVLRYVATMAFVAVAWLVRLALQPWLGATVPYLQFFPAILFASLYGGRGAGLAATAASAVISMAFFLPPAGLAVGATGDVLSLALFVAVGISIAWIGQLFRASERAYREAAARATAEAQRLDTIINNTVDAIIVIGARGAIESFNRGAERMFGYPAADVVGRNVSLLMPSPDHERHDSYLQRYIQTGQATIIGVGREVTGRRRDGSTFPLHLSVGEMVVGGERKFTGMLHDLSRRAILQSQLNASEARWRAVVESAVDGIVVIDEQGRVESINPAAERLFGYAETAVVGRNVSMLMPSPYREEHDGYLSRYVDTGSAKIIGIGREVSGQKKDGSTFPLHLSVGEVTTASGRRFTGILHDLSARVRMEEQLREQAALARLGEMAAVLAHEIKNPLAGIRGVVQIVAGRLPEGSGDRTVMHEIVSRVDALDSMMKDLLVFARPPRPKMRPLDVVPLIDSTAALVKKDAAIRDVTVEVLGTAPPIIGDPEMLRMVFQNLLLNGAHATDGKGRLHVDVAADDHACSISFSDDGPGIPPDVRGKVFAPFFTTKSRGTGLGLPTAKRFVEAHNGRISIDCPPAGGTVVRVQLPLAPAESGDGAPRP